jgi:hypothetical protein
VRANKKGRARRGANATSAASVATAPRRDCSGSERKSCDQRSLGNPQTGSRGKAGPVMGYVSTLMRIQSAFEQAGIRFLNKDSEGGIGVHLAR